MKTYTKYLLVSYALSLVIAVARATSKTETLSLLEHVYFFIATGIFVGSFAYLGMLFRDFVMPDAMLTSGAMDTFKQKIFWMIGPQVIGGVIGLIATQGMHNTLFVKKAERPAHSYPRESTPAENAENSDAEMDPATLSHDAQSN